MKKILFFALLLNFSITLSQTQSDSTTNIQLAIQQGIENTEIKYERPNTQWLAVSFVGAIVAWENFARLYSIDNSNGDINHSVRIRSILVGMVGLGVTLTSTVYALKKVEIKTDGKSLSIAVNF